MRWLTEKEHLKYLAVLLIAVCIIGGLVFRMAGKVSRQFSAMEMPKGAVQELVSREPETEQTYVAAYMACPTYPYQIQVPEGTVEKDGMLQGVMDDIYYIVAEATASIDDLMQDTLPRVLNQPVLGYAPKYEKDIGRDGYLYEKKASYQVGQVRTKINVRSVTEYTCAYMVYLEKDMQLVFYASTEDKTHIQEAENLIRQMAMSTEIYWKQTGEDATGTPQKEAAKAELREFTIEVRNDFFLTNGICVLHWTNVSTEPQEIVFLEDGKVVASAEETYSLPGEYVFIIGEASPKTFQVSGMVEEPLYNVWVNFQELEDYIGYKETGDDPAFWIPRDPD